MKVQDTFIDKDKILEGGKPEKSSWKHLKDQNITKKI